METIYHGSYVACRYDFTIETPKIVDGLQVGVTTSIQVDWSKEPVFGCSGVCKGVDSAKVSQFAAAAKVAITKCEYKGTGGSPGSSWGDNSVGNSTRDVCANPTPIVVGGTSFTSLPQYFDSLPTQYTKYGTASCRKSSSRNIVDQLLLASGGNSLNYIWPNHDPLATAPLGFLQPTDRKSVGGSIADYFKSRADAVLGNGSYMLTTIANLPASGCPLQTGQAVGVNYDQAANKLGANGNKISICAPDYSAGIKTLGEGLQQKVADSYAVNVPDGQVVKSVKLTRQGLTRTLSAVTDYQLVEKTLRFSPGILMVGDELEISIGQ
jgi:hypothetical protein